jgi:hypothetical protein
MTTTETNTDDTTDDAADDTTDIKAELEEQAEAERAKNEMLQRKIDDARVEGWSLSREQGERAVMVKHHHGSLLVHIILLVFTVGVGNLIYWPYCYFGKTDKKVLRV